MPEDILEVDRECDIYENYKVMIKDKDKYAYTYSHEYGPIVRGEFFMGRSILGEYLKTDSSF